MELTLKTRKKSTITQMQKKKRSNIVAEGTIYSSLTMLNARFCIVYEVYAEIKNKIIHVSFHFAS